MCQKAEKRIDFVPIIPVRDTKVDGVWIRCGLFQIDGRKDGEKVNPTLHQKGQWREVSESRGGWGLVFYKPAGEISGHSSLLRPEENRGSLPLYFRL
jgi:hypothetical protein